VADRAGVGFQLETAGDHAAGLFDQIIVSPRTYQLMGAQIISIRAGGSVHRVVGGSAILREAAVPGPGVKP
jgi:hypothetical protein